MKIVIVGGGAAGLFAAINIKNNTNEVTILEKNDMVGKKILVTGNGRCNLWNEDMNINKYYSNDINILDSFFTDSLINNTFSKLEYLFDKFRIRNGYYYPYSNKAATVREILLNECNKLGVEIKTEYEVTSITKKDKFLINNEIECDKVIISTGGCSMPTTGSTGSLFNILSTMGHTINPLKPSLVPLYANEYYLKKWNGIRCSANIELYVDGELKDKESGEIQLTEKGISGVCVFNISHHAVKAIDDGLNVNVKIDFLNMGDNSCEVLSKYEDYRVYDVLLKYLDKKLIDIILDSCDISSDCYFKSLTTKELSKLSKKLSAFSINIIGYGDFNKSEVTQGGISLKDIDINTLESKNIKGLYLIGEVLDVDGKCGGYNLGFAWMSALKVSDHIC